MTDTYQPAPAADSAEAIPVLDSGFIRLVHFMGGDSGAIQAARVTFGSVSKGEERDRKLIEYLLRHNHLTPFEHAVFQFHVKCPIFVARQWMRHRWGSYNEISARYTEVSEEFYIPSSFRQQDSVNKQGSKITGALDHKKLREEFSCVISSAYDRYKSLLEKGVAREMARMVLPVCQYTQFYWTVNARSLMNFISLRADSHAQLEMQNYALAMARVFRERMPWTWDAFRAIIWKGDNAAISSNSL